MNIKQLRLFNEIMITGKISTAAQRLSFSQPAASKMLFNLEDSLDFKLFSRVNGGLEPTPEAQLLHQETLAALQHFQRLENSFARAQKGQLGKLSIATIFGPAYSFLPEILGQYANDHPHLRFNLQILTSAAICEEVASGQSELGLSDKSRISKRFDTKSYLIPCFCAIHKDHPASANEILSPDILDGQSWITFDSETDIYRDLSDSYDQHQANFNPRIEVSSSYNALSFVEQNAGVSIIDAVNKHAYQLKNPQSDILFVPFSAQIFEPLNLLSCNCKPLSKPAQLIYQQIDSTLTKIIKSTH